MRVRRCGDVRVRKVRGCSLLYTRRIILSSDLCQCLFHNCLLTPPLDSFESGIEQQVLQGRGQKIGHYK